MLCQLFIPRFLLRLSPVFLAFIHDCSGMKGKKEWNRCKSFFTALNGKRKSLLLFINHGSFILSVESCFNAPRERRKINVVWEMSGSINCCNYFFGKLRVSLPLLSDDKFEFAEKLYSNFRWSSRWKPFENCAEETLTLLNFIA